MSKNLSKRIGIMAAAVVGFVALFLPWISMNAGILGTISFNAFELGDIDGGTWFVWVSIVLFAAAFLVGLLGKFHKFIPAVIGVLNIVIIAIEFLFRDWAPLGIFDVLGFAVYVSLLVSVALIVLSFLKFGGCEKAEG